MTIQEMNNALDEIRKIYNFDDKKTFISLRDAISMSETKVTIATEDEETGVYIELSKRPERMREQ